MGYEGGREGEGVIWCELVGPVWGLNFMALSFFFISLCLTRDGGRLR